MVQKTWWFLVALIVVLNSLRFAGLNVSPPGLYSDESADAMHLVCLKETGTDATGDFLPLFSLQVRNWQREGGAMIPPTYLYFGVLWVAVFGHSIASIRAIPAFLMAMTTFGVFLLVRLFFPPRAAVLCALTASLSPWAFQLGRFSLHAFELVCLVFCLYFFFRSQKLFDAILAGVVLSLTLYTYPPARVQVPILLFPMLRMKQSHQGLNKKFLTAFISTALVASLPLAYNLTNPQDQVRWEHVAIFGRHYLNRPEVSYSLLGILRTFLANFWAHFSPDFLLFTGDANLRHSTQAVGELSWLDIFAFLAGATVFLACLLDRLFGSNNPANRAKNLNPFIVFSVTGLLSGIVPAALTWEAIPHAGRSAGALPFLVVLSGLTLWKLSTMWESIAVVVAGISVLFAFHFFSQYFEKYPTASRNSFDAPVREAAEQARRTGDWSHFTAVTRNYPEFSTRYYLVEFGGEDCLSSKRRFEEARSHAE